MTPEVRVCGPDEPIVDCARAMASNDIGALPVAENNLLVGMVTDRDIAIRAVAAGKGPGTPIREVLSREVLYCFEDQDLEHVATSMGTAKVRRVPVLTRDNRVAGSSVRASTEFLHTTGVVLAPSPPSVCVGVPGVDEATAQAKYTDGVLELTLPKKAAAAAKKLAVH
jgi:CBS domain-containing protein